MGKVPRGWDMIVPRGRKRPVRNGWRFVCTRLGAGPAVPIHVVEIDDRGRLRWSQGG